ncbi:MAG: hypothetical protein WD534_06645 [Phycisphaeraceae bacterium]
MPRQDDDANAMTDAIKECLSPHAVALIAAKLQPAYGKGEIGQQAEREAAWFADRLIEAIGVEPFNQLCEELGL